MERRTLLASGLFLLAAGPALAQPAPQGAPPPDGQWSNGDQGPPPGPNGDLPPPQQGPNGYQGPPQQGQNGYQGPPPQGQPAQEYSHDEIVGRVSDFLGVTAESAGGAVERLFKENGRPTGYIAGEEGAAAFIVGLRYGKGLLYMKDRPTQAVYWQGPSAGFDFGGNASRVFVLCYDLEFPDAIYRRFPGVEGSAYLVGGLGVNYQRADGITVAPIRAGLGLRLGANVGYLAYSRHQNIIPL